MSDEALFEKWRRDRSQFDPTEGFADRVLQEIQGLPLPSKALPGELSPIGTAAKSCSVSGSQYVTSAATSEEP